MLNHRGRYKVAEIDNRIIAVSGILQENITPYNGYEVTWTCCLPEYRKNGIICNILMNCISDIKEDSFNVYCSCWRIHNNTDINMSSVMKRLGFKEIIHNRISYKYPNYKQCNECLYCIKHNC